MVDYAKKTVVDLQEILKSRSLPSSGKKADLVARLQEADKAAESNEEAKAPPAPSTSAPPKQKPTPEAAVARKPAPEPKKAAPEPTPTATEPKAAITSTDGAAAADSPSANTDTALASSAQYALNLPVSSVDDEMAKRKARAERFGTGAANGETGAAGTEAKDDEAEKSLERAKRFGTGQTAMGKLDQALPMEREKGNRKRNRTEEGGELEDPGLLRKFRGRGGFRGGFRGRRRGGGGGGGGDGQRPSGVQKAGAYSSDKDKATAEARKKRFAAA